MYCVYDKWIEFAILKIAIRKKYHAVSSQPNCTTKIQYIRVTFNDIVRIHKHKKEKNIPASYIHYIVCILVLFKISCMIIDEKIIKMKGYKVCKKYIYKNIFSKTVGS